MRPQIYSTSAPDFLVRDTLDSHTVTSLRAIARISHISRSMSLQKSPIAKESYISYTKTYIFAKEPKYDRHFLASYCPRFPHYLNLPRTLCEIALSCQRRSSNLQRFSKFVATVYYKCPNVYIHMQLCIYIYMHLCICIHI